MEYDFELLKKQYEKLPSDIRIAISSTDVAQKIADIAENHKLMLDKVDELSKEVSFVMLGLTLPSDLVKNLRRRLDISTETALAIAQDINDEVFLPIRESLKNIRQEKVTFEEETPAQPQDVNERELTPQQKKYAPFFRPLKRPTAPESPEAPSVKMEPKIVVSSEETQALQGDLPQKQVQESVIATEPAKSQPFTSQKPEPAPKPVPPPEPPKPQVRYTPAREVSQPAQKPQQRESQPTQRRYIDPYLMNRARLLYEIENPTEIKHNEPEPKSISESSSTPTSAPKPPTPPAQPSQKYDVRPHSPERLKSEALLRPQRPQTTTPAPLSLPQVQQKPPVMPANSPISTSSITRQTKKAPEKVPVVEEKPQEKVVLNDLSNHKSPYKPHFDPPTQKVAPKEPINTPNNNTPPKKIIPEVKVEPKPKQEHLESTPHPELLPEIMPEQHLAIKKGETAHEIPTGNKPKQADFKQPVHDIVEKYPKNIVERKQITEEKLIQQTEIKPIVGKTIQKQEIVKETIKEEKPVSKLKPEPETIPKPLTEPAPTVKPVQTPPKKLFSIMDHLMSAPKSSKGERKQDPYREPI